MIAAPSDKTTLAQRQCGGQTAYRLCPPLRQCHPLITLTSADMSSTTPPPYHPPCLPHHYQADLCTPAIRKNHDVMLVPLDQSVPKTRQNQKFCQKAVKTSFLPISLCLFYVLFGWFSTTKTTLLLHSPPTRELNSAARSLSSACHPHCVPGIHKTGIYPNSSPKTCFSSFLQKIAGRTKFRIKNTVLPTNLCF